MDTQFEALWSQQEFELPDTKPTLCEYAQKFADSIAPLIEKAVAKGEIVTINQAVLLVTHRFFEWRAYVPKSHRNRVSEFGHTCIFHVFETAYQRLKLAELEMAPPMLFVPAPPPLPPAPVSAPAPIQIAGIFLGEET